MIDDGTLGGYLDRHERPPAFEGSDGAAYSADLYVDGEPENDGTYGGAVLFVRWSASGDRPEGHLETPFIVRGASVAEVKEQLRALTLLEVKRHLELSIAASGERPVW